MGKTNIESQEMLDFKAELRGLLINEGSQLKAVNRLVIDGPSASNPQLRTFLIGLTNSLRQCNCDITKLMPEDLNKNPYFSKIKFPKLGEGIQVGTLLLESNRRMTRKIAGPYKCPTRDPNTLELIQHMCVFPDTVYFPAVSEKNGERCWMSVEPSEINSFEKIIENAHGNVLLFGCGLCYAAYMIALKDNVTSVTVVDINPNMVELCQKHVVPQFEEHVQAKINFEISDAIGYMETKGDLFDYINVDIWYSTDDMLITYLRCMGIEQKLDGIDVSYWLEEKLMIEMQSAFMRAFCNYEYSGNCNIGDVLMMQIAGDILSESSISIATPDDFKKFINMDVVTFRKRMLQWYLKNKDMVDQTDVTPASMLNLLNRVGRKH